MTASLPDLSPVEEEQQLLIANTEDVLDPAFHQTIQEIMANITRFDEKLDEKMGPVSQTLKAHARQLKKNEERATEAENKISATEHTSEVAKQRIQVLENQ